MVLNQKVSVLVGLQHGDEGKGKISHYLNTKENYDCFVRFNGGPNAGHTIYHNGMKLVLHQIPCGILQGKPCLISTGCVIDIEKLECEASMLREIGIDIDRLLYLAYNAHIIDEECINEDKRSDKVGTTGSGIGPTYSRKALRIGKRVCDINMHYNIVEPFEFLSRFKNIFLEGAQGYELDINCGDYPFVTSSSCITGAIFTNGISPIILPKVIGVCKLYDTYVGSKEFQPDDEIFIRLQELGNEYGATTGRPRQCNWLNLDRLVKAVNINSVNELYINKCDVIDDLRVYQLIVNGELKTFENINTMKMFITNYLLEHTSVELIKFSGNPKSI